MVGNVIGESPIADGTGHEFTLDLGDEALSLEQLKKRIPGSEVVALEANLLQVRLPPMAE